MTQEFITGAVELCDPSYARTLAFVRLVHAASFVQQRDPGQAVAVATEAIRLAAASSHSGTFATSAICARTWMYMPEKETCVPSGAWWSRSTRPSGAI